MSLLKAEREKRIALKELEALAQKIKKKNWKNYKGTKLYDDEFKKKNKRKPKKISDVTKGINVIDKKLDKIINENVKLKEEISDIKAEQKKQKDIKIKKEIIQKPKSIIEIMREGGGKIDMDTYMENEKLKVKLEKDKKKAR